MNRNFDVLVGVSDPRPLLTVPDVEYTFSGSVCVGVDGEVVGASNTCPKLLLRSFRGVRNVSFHNFEGSVRGFLLVIPCVSSCSVSRNFKANGLPLLQVSADLGEASQCDHVSKVQGKHGLFRIYVSCENLRISSSYSHDKGGKS